MPMFNRKPLIQISKTIQDVQSTILHVEDAYAKAGETYSNELQKWSKDIDRVIVESCSIGIWGRIKFV